MQGQIGKRSSNELEGDPETKSGAADIKRAKNNKNREDDIVVDVESVDEGEGRLVIDTADSDFSQHNSQQKSSPSMKNCPETLSFVQKSPQNHHTTTAPISSYANFSAAEMGRKNVKRRVQNPPTKLSKLANPVPGIVPTPAEGELKYYYQNSLGRFFHGRPGIDDVALDLSLKRKGNMPPEFEGITGGPVRTCAGFSCVTLPTVCVEAGRQNSEMNNKRPSVIKSKEFEPLKRTSAAKESRSIVLSSSEPDVQEHFRKSLSSQRVYGASAEVEDHFARALGSTWWELKQALNDTESPSSRSSSLSPKSNTSFGLNRPAHSPLASGMKIHKS